MKKEDKNKFKSLFSAYCRDEVNAGRCEADSCEFCPVNQAYEKIFVGIPASEDFLDMLDDIISKQYDIKDGDHNSLIFRDKENDMDYQITLTEDFCGDMIPEKPCSDTGVKRIWEFIEKELANRGYEIVSISEPQLIFRFDEDTDFELSLSQLS